MFIRKNRLKENVKKRMLKRKNSLKENVEKIIVYKRVLKERIV